MTFPAMRRFPDVQVEFKNAVDVLFGVTGRTGIETPDDWEGRLPFVRSRSRPGGGSDHVNALLSLDVDVFALSYADTEQLAHLIHQWLCGPPPGIRTFDRVEGAVPVELPWDDGRTVRRFGSSYSVVARRTAPI